MFVDLLGLKNEVQEKLDILLDNDIRTNDTKLDFLKSLDPEWRSTIEGKNKSEIKIKFTDALRNKFSEIYNNPISANTLVSFLSVWVFACVVYLIKIYLPI